MIAQLVRQNREAKGWTQADLAEATGLRQTYISKLENGDIAVPRDHNIDKLADAFGLQRADFYEAAGIQAPRDEGKYEPSIQKFRNLSERPRLAAQLRQFDQFDDSLAEAVENVVIALIDQRRRGESQDH